MFFSKFTLVFVTIQHYIFFFVILFVSEGAHSIDLEALNESIVDRNDYDGLSCLVFSYMEFVRVLCYNGLIIFIFFLSINLLMSYLYKFIVRVYVLIY